MFWISLDLFCGMNDMKATRPSKRARLTEEGPLYSWRANYHILEIVFTRAAPAFDNLFMGCVFNINTVHKTVEKLTFQSFY